VGVARWLVVEFEKSLQAAGDLAAMKAIRMRQKQSE
jgi:hypothetical protein